MTTQPNPFNNTASSLKGVIDAAASVIAGQPVMPDSYSSHADSAAEELMKLDVSPHLADDGRKILKRHFDTASNGDPQSTKLQQSFEKEVNQRLQQLRAKAKWKDAAKDDA